MGILEDITAQRESFRERVAQIDENLRNRRRIEVAGEVNAIAELVATAYGQGHSINAIKAAYGTKDHATIRRMIDEHAAAVEAGRADAMASLPEETKPEEKPEWFTWDAASRSFDVTLVGETARVDVMKMDDGDFMLLVDDESSGLHDLFDGRLVSGGDNDYIVALGEYLKGNVGQWI